MGAAFAAAAAPAAAAAAALRVAAVQGLAMASPRCLLKVHLLIVSYTPLPPPLPCSPPSSLATRFLTPNLSLTTPLPPQGSGRDKRKKNAKKLGKAGTSNYCPPRHGHAI